MIVCYIFGAKMWSLFKNEKIVKILMARIFYKYLVHNKLIMRVIYSLNLI